MGISLPDFNRNPTTIMRLWLDLMILMDSSNLNNSIILWFQAPKFKVSKQEWFDESTFVYRAAGTQLSLESVLMCFPHVILS